jgi:hypothetical protein
VAHPFLHRCIQGEASVSRLADVYPMSFAAVQKHVAVLERAGLVTKERCGRKQLVRTDPDAVGRARRVLDELETAWRGRVDRMADLLAQVPQHETNTAVYGTRRMSVVSVEKDFGSLSLTLAADFDAPIGQSARSLEFTDGFADQDGTPNADLPTTAV